MTGIRCNLEFTAAPQAVKEGVAQDEADTIKGQLEEAGASVEIK